MNIIAGKYEVLKELGEGGAGTVYQVKHTDLGVIYALKLLKPELVDQRFIDRFKREAEVLIRFNHPGSVALRDFGKTETGAYYMAMDYCEGTTLHDLILAQGEIPMRRVLKITEQLLETLHAAHTAGIVHRDIKPENIMLDKASDGSDFVRILDFGIAKLKEQKNDPSRTMDGVSVGTPQYMSPEQASGEANLDHRVDIYSLGCVVYEMLTGQPPFAADTVLQTLIMHLTQPPPPFAAEYGFPDYVESFVFRALEKNRESRYQSGEEFLSSLRKLKETLFPVAKDSQEVKPVKESHQLDNQASQAPIVAKKPTKILCLDDSDMILHIFKHILEEKGYIVYTANNSAAVHQYLFQEKVDLLVTDVQMPDIPGTKVCRMLKKTIPDLKVVLFSNLPERELEAMSNESKADGWISKNTKPKEWVEKIVEVLELENIK
jgi:serine/threonine protein kinase